MEHAAGPSVPARYTNGYTVPGASTYNQGPVDIADVEYEGFEEDENEEQPPESSMIQAVSY